MLRVHDNLGVQYVRPVISSVHGDTSVDFLRRQSRDGGGELAAGCRAWSRSRRGGGGSSTGAARETAQGNAAEGVRAVSRPQRATEGTEVAHGYGE